MFYHEKLIMVHPVHLIRDAIMISNGQRCIYACNPAIALILSKAPLRLCEKKKTTHRYANTRDAGVCNLFGVPTVRKDLRCDYNSKGKGIHK